MLVLFTGCGRQEAVFLTTVQPEETEEGQTGTEQSVQTETAALTTEAERLVAVYVCGAVKNSGVYYLNASDIRETAIRLAGGFAENADDTYVNLAQKVTEGERIYVPTKEETAQGMNYETGVDGMQTSGEAESGKININTAGREELMTLPGIGESKADAILAYRETQGKFQSTDELMNISGIKEGVYNKIKDFIVVN